MAGFTCPYCGMTMAINNSTKSKQTPSFEHYDGYYTTPGGKKFYDSALDIIFYKCPNCGQYTIMAKGVGTSIKDVDTIIRPRSTANQYPPYIPQQIREDYEEACAILYLSPKASATLARRCLQGMIRDFWKIAKDTLNAEINALKDKVQPDLWAALNSLVRMRSPVQIWLAAPKQTTTLRVVVFVLELLALELAKPVKIWWRARPPPVADKGRAQPAQRSKKSSKRYAAMIFSGHRKGQAAYAAIGGHLALRQI